jgi:hypothetical protein
MHPAVLCPILATDRESAMREVVEYECEALRLEDLFVDRDTLEPSGILD